LTPIGVCCISETHAGASRAKRTTHLSAILRRGFDNSPVRRPTATGNTSRVDCLDGNARLDCFSPLIAGVGSIPARMKLTRPATLRRTPAGYSFGFRPRFLAGSTPIAACILAISSAAAFAAPRRSAASISAASAVRNCSSALSTAFIHHLQRAMTQAHTSESDKP